MNKKLRIKTVLQKSDGVQKLFTYIFDRTLELCSYHYPDAENAKKIFEEKLLAFDLNSYDSYLNEFMSYLNRKDDDKDNQKFCLLFYEAVSVLKLSYQYCYENYNDNKPTPFDKLIGVTSKQGVEITTILHSLASLERLAARYYAGRVTGYFVNKEIEQKLKPRAKGGYIKAENERKRVEPIKKEAIRLFKNQAYKNKHHINGQQPFARHFALQYNFELKKNNPDVPDKDLDYLKESSVKRWIKDYLEKC